VLRVPEGRLLLQTVRSHDQYNTTIYGLDDRYRGVKDGRRVVFVNPDDLAGLGLSDGQLVDLVSEWPDSSIPPGGGRIEIGVPPGGGRNEIGVPPGGGRNEIGVPPGGGRKEIGVPPGGGRKEITVSERRAERFTVLAYPTARGCAAAYFPEANSLVPLDSTAETSNTPTSKSIVVRLDRV
jgi:anaerobic selenocysteine-containing dehydrogenase